MTDGDELIVDHPLLQRLYQFWLERRGARTMPSRADIVPELIPDLLPHVYIVEVLLSPRRFRVRLAGSSVVTEFGEHITGCFIDELDLDELSAPILQDYERAAREGRPVATRWNYTKRSGRHLAYERLLLPLSENEVDVTRLLCGAIGKGIG